MKLSAIIVAGSAVLPGALAWGGFGHITVAYVAQNFVNPETKEYFQILLRNNTEHYLAGVATWADSVRYTKWGRFTGPFHFIDAKDHPPTSCNVDLERDCKQEGCVVTAIANYTQQVLDPDLPLWLQEQAAKFVIHFVSDIHQPLHTEDVARGGNGIHVRFNGVELNLHHVWDSSIPEKVGHGRQKKPFPQAQRWATELTAEIVSGKFRSQSVDWLDDIDIADPVGTALAWAQESNVYVCSHVLPEGPRAIVNKELGGDYYYKAAPVVELLVARAGYRLAAWLDLIASAAIEQSRASSDL